MSSEGDRRDFDWQMLYTEINERVFRMLHRMTGDAEQAADLVHDTFVQVYERHSQYTGSGSLHAWVFRIAANLARDALRARKVREFHEPRVQGLQFGASHGAPPDHALILDLERALSKIKPSHRAVLLLHDVDGYAHREIAEMLDIAVGTSKAILSRARDKVRRFLDEGRE